VASNVLISAIVGALIGLAVAVMTVFGRKFDSGP
jgi:uncharacterized YccA/Bax inhibitor family protein